MPAGLAVRQPSNNRPFTAFSTDTSMHIFAPAFARIRCRSLIAIVAVFVTFATGVGAPCILADAQLFGAQRLPLAIFFILLGTARTARSVISRVSTIYAETLLFTGFP